VATIGLNWKDIWKPVWKAVWTPSVSVPVTGDLATTNANDTLSAVGFSGVIDGSLAVTNANDTLVAHGRGASVVPPGGGTARRLALKAEAERQQQEEEALAFRIREDREMVNAILAIFTLDKVF
jgi:hypothetical protein